MTIRVPDRAASERFDATVLSTLGVEPLHDAEGLLEWDNDFSLGHPGHYGAYVLDPGGNNIERVNHDRS